VAPRGQGKRPGSSSVQRGLERLVGLTEVKHADPRVARQGRIVVALLFALIALAVAFLPFVTLLPDPGPVFLAVSLAVVPFVGIAWVIRRGRVLLGSVLTLLTYMSALVLGVLMSHKIGNGPQFVALAVTMAGATLGVRQVLVTLGASFGVLAAMSVLSHGSAQQFVSVTDLILYAALLCSVTAVVSAVTAYAVRRTFLAEDEALRRSRQLSAELQEANHSLELRVAERTAELEDALRSQTQLASRLAELSVRDALTGLYNRRHLDAEVVRMFEESVRYGRPLCVALLDLDSFKAVNDRFGHDCGDEVLRRVSRILVECTRGADLVARYGGEELALVMPDTSMTAALEACERIRQQVEFEPWDEVRAGLTVTVSAGLAQIRGHDTIWHLLREADQRLYAAKAAGRNRVVAGERIAG
jgi:diguanylate cyclase (GGDEF)-like protein